MTEPSAVCFECGVRRPSVGMINVIAHIEDDPEQDHEVMVFCSWKCLSFYALDVVTP